MKGFYFSLDATLGLFVLTSLMVASFTIFNSSMSLTAQPIDEAEADRALMDVSYLMYRESPSDVSDVKDDRKLSNYVVSKYEDNQEEVEGVLEDFTEGIEQDFKFSVINETDETVILNQDFGDKIGADIMGIDEEESKPIKIRISTGIE